MSQPAFDFGATEFDDAASPTYTVGELADAINDQLQRGFGDGVWVRGEIDGLAHRGPHTYFTLVERTDDTSAVLNVQLFAPMKRRLRPLLERNRLELRNGMKVRIHGHLDFWSPGGRLGLKMAGLDPRYTLGEIAQSRDEVVRRLVADGLFDRNARLMIAPLPLRVGVVTSIDSAAWHDFHDELARSGAAFQLAVADVRVQGDVAVAMVSGALRALGRRTDIDVIVVIRGGGARNELAVFDADTIARAIALAPVPVLTGLGHEIDRSVADDVAHTALKTPTACAGALVDRVTAARDRSERAWAGVLASSVARLDDATADLSDRAHRIARRTHAAVGRADERLTMRQDQLASRGPAALTLARSRLDRAAERMAERPVNRLEREADRLDVTAARIAALDPAVQLARGWSITRRHDGSIIRSVDDVAVGDAVITSVADGAVRSTVTDHTPLAED